MGLRTEMVQWEVLFVFFTFRIPRDYLLRERRLLASRVQSPTEVSNLLLLTSVREASYSSGSSLSVRYGFPRGDENGRRIGKRWRGRLAFARLIQFVTFQEPDGHSVQLRASQIQLSSAAPSTQISFSRSCPNPILRTEDVVHRHFQLY